MGCGGGGGERQAGSNTKTLDQNVLWVAKGVQQAQQPQRRAALALTHLPLSSLKMSDLARPLRPWARCCCWANIRMEGSRITPWG